MGRRNPLRDWAHFSLGERYPWRNHARQIWWRSLKGFRGSCGSNFSISHWLCWSSLQHSHTTVWACDLMLIKSCIKWHLCQQFGDTCICIIIYAATAVVAIPASPQAQVPQMLFNRLQATDAVTGEGANRRLNYRKQRVRILAFCCAPVFCGFCVCVNGRQGYV